MLLGFQKVKEVVSSLRLPGVILGLGGSQTPPKRLSHSRCRETGVAGQQKSHLHKTTICNNFICKDFLLWLNGVAAWFVI